MELVKGAEYLEWQTGIVYRLFNVSKHGTCCQIASRKNGEGEFIPHFSPSYSKEEIRIKVTSGNWIPNTPAGRALYGHR